MLSYSTASPCHVQFYTRRKIQLCEKVSCKGGAERNICVRNVCKFHVVILFAILCSLEPHLLTISMHASDLVPCQ